MANDEYLLPFALVLEDKEVEAEDGGRSSGTRRCVLVSENSD